MAKRKLSPKQGKEIKNIIAAFAAPAVASQALKFIGNNVPVISANPVMGSSLMGLIGAGMVFLGQDNLNAAGYSLIGAAGFDMSDNVGDALQGLTRISAGQMAGVTRIDADMFDDEDDDFEM